MTPKGTPTPAPIAVASFDDEVEVSGAAEEFELGAEVPEVDCTGAVVKYTEDDVALGIDKVVLVGLAVTPIVVRGLGWPANRRTFWPEAQLQLETAES